MRITIAQLDPVVGDVDGNVCRLERALRTAKEAFADLAVFPELFLVGYPPKDLLERDWFMRQAEEGVRQVLELSRLCPEQGIVVGAPVRTLRTNGRGLANAALLVYRGEIIGRADKRLLPTYDVFDEERYFDPAPSVSVIPFKGHRLGVHICEDAWTDTTLWSRRSLYDVDPVAELGEQGATLLINISASPFSVGKAEVRYQLMSEHARRHQVPFIYVNQIGSNDELVFDGGSLALDAHGDPLAVLPSFTEVIRTIDTSGLGDIALGTIPEPIATVHGALVLGIRDYMAKCGFTKAIVGLSGGIDSAVTCALAASAVGAENVLGVTMPSEYSSRGSVDDSRQLAENLGIDFKVIPISTIHHSYLASLADSYSGTQANVAEENVQARIRGNILMALSNKYGYLVLSTGNKSELAVGYCTLYGDMSGGLAAISDVPKTMVYELAHYINRQGEIIPRESIDKAPSAELKPDQVDQDTLPPYPVLDLILQGYVEEAASVQDLIERGFDPETVRWVVRTVDRVEYKRRQAAPGLRVTTKAFGVGRRMPIAARFMA